MSEEEKDEGNKTVGRNESVMNDVFVRRDTNHRRPRIGKSSKGQGGWISVEAGGRR